MKDLVKLKKIGKTSNGSYRVVRITTKVSIQSRFKKLLLCKKWMSGRSSTGRITVFTKGTRIKRVSPILNYNFRFKSIFFIGGLNYVNFCKKLSLLVFTSTGLVSYLPAKLGDNFFF